MFDKGYNLHSLVDSCAGGNGVPGGGGQEGKIGTTVIA